MHPCTFYNLAFNLSADLFKDIWEVHKERKCAICYKRLSVHCRLKSHMKRVHGIKVTAIMALIDFVRTKESGDDNKNLPTSDGIDLEKGIPFVISFGFGYNSESIEINLY
uniref:C2H2-type domain-containing protein n=1 Tax=Glossina pallidipes TaxID=7398 RepID=A0A1B0A788_GLOPL